MERAFFFILFLLLADAASSHNYQFTQPVPVLVNHVGPYKNPSETYDYYDLPFCRPPAGVQHRHASLGEKLEGDHYERSLYDIRFEVDINWQVVCQLHLLKDEIATLKRAVKDQYYFHMLIDGLPVNGFVGEMRNVDGISTEFMYTHLKFDLLFNGENVIHASVIGEQAKALDRDELTLEFSFSAKWRPTDITYEHRLDYLKNEKMFPHELEIHWLSILNSFVLVVLLTGFVVVIILRVLKADYARYNRANATGDDTEDYGWKLVHGDVFRTPQNCSLFCALIGIGVQFFVLCFLGLFLAVAELISPTLPGGSVYITAIILYSLTNAVSGFVSSGLYSQIGDGQWAWNIITTSTVFFIPFFLISVILNIIASIYHTTHALSPSTLVFLLSIYLFVGFPLTVVGGIAGRHMWPPYEPPCRTNHFVRAIPTPPFYRSAPMQYFVAGFLPFSGIYIELHYLFNSVWGHNSYHLYGILFLVFIILIIVTSCITIALTYFQLSLEDHHWWWRSFFSGGATGVFIFLYSIFFYYYRSGMSGLLQGSFFFGRILIVCYTFWIMLGAIGSLSAIVFVRTIYDRLKIE